MTDEKLDYGWYHKRMITTSFIIGFIGLISIIFNFVFVDYIRLIFIILGLIGIIFFLWPSLGLIAVNIQTDNNKSHPTTNLREIFELESPKILDIGCGTGRCAIKFAKNLKNGGHVYGIDIFNNAISGNSLKKVQTNAKIENVDSITTFKFGSILDIPFQNDYFDVVNISYVLHEIEDKVKALSEINRVLKTNGWLFISEFHKKNIITILYNGIYTFHYKNNGYWIKLLEENQFADIIYTNDGPIAIISGLKKKI